MIYPKVESIFELLNKWRNHPAYQLERRADIFFALFLPDVLNHHLSKRKRGIEIDRRLIPEFPLKRREDNNSRKADYLALSIDHKGALGRHAFLIELKTDSASLNTDQSRNQYYFLKDVAEHRNMHELLCGLKCIVKADSVVKNTKIRMKYFHLLNELEKLKLVKLDKKRIFSSSHGSYKSNVNVVEAIKTVSVPDSVKKISLEIIYVLPATAPVDFEFEFDSIDFRNFAETVKDRGEIGKVFARSLRRWAKTEAGAEPVK